MLILRCYQTLKFQSFAFPFTWLSHHTTSNYFYICYDFFTTLFKIFPTLHMECFFRIGNPTYFFFLLRKVETMCQWFISLLVLLNVLLISIIILLSYKMLFSLDILCLWTMVSIGRLLQVPLPLLQVCCFIINNLPTLFCSDQFIAKDNAFSK